MRAEHRRLANRGGWRYQSAPVTRWVVGGLYNGESSRELWLSPQSTHIELPRGAMDSTQTPSADERRTTGRACRGRRPNLGFDVVGETHSRAHA
jgi:hypothetical protein